VLLAGWLAGPVLKRAVDNPMAVLDEALLPSEAAKRFGLMWRSVSGRW
jgi:hypothetical protein